MKSMREVIVESRKEVFSELDKELHSIGDWFVFYTHPYNGNEKDKNMLVFPKDISDVDFYGMVLDLVNDYNDMKGRKVKDDLYVKVLVEVLKKANQGQIDLRKRP